VPSDDVVRFSGTVTGINRGGIFDVAIPVGDGIEPRKVIARCSGRMRQHQIKIVVGDLVEVEFSPYDLAQGRIVHRTR
jgi:translation initiation factor IF-1